MSDDTKLNAIFGCVVAIIAALIVLVIYLSVVEEHEWTAYADAHHCYVVSTRAGHTRTTSGYVGGKLAQGTTYEPGETCWSCDPGPLGVEVCR